MPLSITSSVRANGPSCDHVTVTVNHEGTERTFRVSLSEIDDTLREMTPAERAKALVVLWAAYRRSHNRTIVGVNIA